MMELPRVKSVRRHDLLVSFAQIELNGKPIIILTTEFSTPWFDQIKKSSAWAQLSNSEAESWHCCCQKLQALSYKLPLTAEQESVIIELQKTLAEQDDKFAVRSSSPDEDLLSYSFAGGYETKLGVGQQGRLHEVW